MRENDSTFLLYNIKDFYEANNNDTVFSYSMTGLAPGLVLAPGDKLTLFSSGGGSSGLGPIAEFLNDYFYKSRSKVFFIEYESVFEDAWVIESSFQYFTKEEYGEFEVFYNLIE